MTQHEIAETGKATCDCIACRMLNAIQAEEERAASIPDMQAVMKAETSKQAVARAFGVASMLAGLSPDYFSEVEKAYKLTQGASEEDAKLVHGLRLVHSQIRRLLIDAGKMDESPYDRDAWSYDDLLGSVISEAAREREEKAALLMENKQLREDLELLNLGLSGAASQLSLVEAKLAQCAEIIAPKNSAKSAVKPIDT